MNEATDSTEAVIEKVRREVARRRGTKESATPPPPPPASPKDMTLDKALASIDRAKSKHLRAHKWPRPLRPLRRNQEGINEGLISAAQALAKQVDYLTRLTKPLVTQQSRLATQLQQEAECRRALEEQLKEVLGERIQSLSKTLEEHIEIVRKHTEAQGERIQALEDLSQVSQTPPDRVNAFYVAFEDKFRGSPDLIRERSMTYLPFLQSSKERCPGGAALDLGSGRGEWLEVLAGLGIEASGVDLNDQMVKACQQAGLKTQKADALEHLRHFPEGSLALVSGFHIVEHLEFTKLLALFAEIHRVLMPGGIAIFETPNPECLRVSTYSFYMDPTHRNPVPMELLSFIATHTGFSATQVERLHPYCEKGELQAYGDYAAIFTK